MVKMTLPELPALLYAAQILYPGLSLMTIIQRAIRYKYAMYSNERLFNSGASLNDGQLITALKAFIAK